MTFLRPFSGCCKRRRKSSEHRSHLVRTRPTSRHRVRRGRRAGREDPGKMEMESFLPSPLLPDFSPSCSFPLPALSTSEAHRKDVPSGIAAQQLRGSPPSSLFSWCLPQARGTRKSRRRCFDSGTPPTATRRRKQKRKRGKRRFRQAGGERVEDRHLRKNEKMRNGGRLEEEARDESCCL